MWCRHSLKLLIQAARTRRPFADNSVRATYPQRSLICSSEMAVSVSTPAKAFEADARQREAIEHVNGPMLVVAGAGTGKTTVLTKRIACLIRDGHASPEEILAVTYTKNSAQEMRERVQAELKEVNLRNLHIGTFHEYCNSVLFGCGKQFGLLDDKDLWIFLRKRIRDLHLNYFVRAADVGKFLNDLLEFMRRCQDELVGPEKYAEYVARLESGELLLPRVAKAKDAELLTADEILGRCREISSVFTIVEKMLAAENFGAFGHMITRAYDLLRSDAQLLAAERARTRFILVDEFQDANYAQVKILKLLASDEQNVFAVGDPDQAIYQFRGASSAAFALFQHQFPGAKLVALQKNRRSTTAILSTAFSLIAKNPDVARIAPASDAPYRRSQLISARDEEAAREGRIAPFFPVEAALSVGKDTECSDVVAAIQRGRRELRCNWKKFAVLYRLHVHRDQVAEELAAAGIPFSIENMDVVDTPEARDLLACLGAVFSERDGASLFRVAALPQFGIDPRTLRAGMKALPRDQNAGVSDVLGMIVNGPAVLEVLRQAREEIAVSGAKSRRAAEIVIRHFTLPRSRPLSAVLEFIQAWEEKAITKTKELGELLEYLEYFREAGGAIPMTSRDEDAVSLMTAHTAKGLEWDHVFILRANSGSFPCGYRQSLVEFPAELREDDSFAQSEGKLLHEQEERRLFYVAMTRARDSLTIYARQGRGKKDPTPPGYLRELLDDASIRPWFRKREALAFAGELFAEEAARPASVSRTAEWLEMPPQADLSQRLSATAVEIYKTCPLQFKLEREWRIPRDVPAALQFGAAMHRVLRTYYDYVRAQRSVKEEELIELLRADLGTAGIQDGYQFELYEQQGITQLRDFVATARAAMPEVLHTEEWFEMRMGGATVVGRIDRMDRSRDGRVVITDYKTGKPKSQEDADESLQLSIYALAAREKWGYEVESLVLYNLTESAAVTTRRCEAELQGARMQVEEAAQQIMAGDFRAKPGFHCNFCPYHNLCPATEKRLYSIAMELAKSSGKKRSGKFN
jgi:DNA helicase-2/ATP-dependent DNA helicase PcrA